MQMRIIKVALLVLAVMHLLFVAVTAAVGGFADGGDLLQRLTLMVVHPVTAVVVLYLVAARAPAPLALRIGSVLIALNVVLDVYLAIAFLSGALLGDWWLAAAFAVVPILGLIYAWTASARRAA